MVYWLLRKASLIAVGVVTYCVVSCDVCEIIVVKAFNPMGFSLKFVFSEVFTVDGVVNLQCYEQAFLMCSPSFQQILSQDKSRQIPIQSELKTILTA